MSHVRVLYVWIALLLAAPLWAALKPALGNEVEATVNARVNADGSRTIEVQRKVDLAGLVADRVKKEKIDWEIDLDRETYRGRRTRIASLEGSSSPDGPRHPDQDDAPYGGDLSGAKLTLRNTAFATWTACSGCPATEEFQIVTDHEVSYCPEGLLLNDTFGSCIKGSDAWTTVEPCIVSRPEYEVFQPYGFETLTSSAYRSPDGYSTLRFSSVGIFHPDGTWETFGTGTLTGGGIVQFSESFDVLGVTAAECPNLVPQIGPGNGPPQDASPELVEIDPMDGAWCVSVKVNGVSKGQCCGWSTGQIIDCARGKV